MISQKEKAAAIEASDELEQKLNQSIARRMVEQIQQEKKLKDIEQELQEVKKKKLR